MYGRGFDARVAAERDEARRRDDEGRAEWRANAEAIRAETHRQTLAQERIAAALEKLAGVERLPTDAGTGAVASGEAAGGMLTECCRLAVPGGSARIIVSRCYDCGRLSAVQEGCHPRCPVCAPQADAIKAAVASERERCLAWVELQHRYWESVECDVLDPIREGIRSGADAPGAGKP